VGIGHRVILAVREDGRVPREPRAWLVWGIGVFAYAVAVFQRTSLGVAAGPATERFDIGASLLATLAVVQLAAYAALQIPVGVLLDRFGSRMLLVGGALLMAGGQLWLSQADAASGAVLARLLVGAGDAMTFTSVLRLLPAWFAPSRVPVLTQVTGQIGQLGQVASTFPLVAALAGPGWTASYLGAAAVAVISAMAVWLGVRDRPPHATDPGPRLSLRQANRNVAAAFLRPGSRLGLWTHFTTQFSGMVFALLWGFPYLTTGLGYHPGLAGILLMVMVLSGVVVGPVLGHLTARFPLRRSNLVFGVLAATIGGWTLVLLWPGRPALPVVVLLVLVLSAYGPASAVGFDFARTFNPASRLGAATGIVNMGGFVATLVTIFVIGVILDFVAPDGRYTRADFELALGFQYVIWGFGLFAVWRTRRLVRAELRQQGTHIDPLPRAVARRWRTRRGG